MSDSEKAAQEIVEHLHKELVLEEQCECDCADCLKLLAANIRQIIDKHMC